MSRHYNNKIYYINDNADNIWRAPTLRLPRENVNQQLKQHESTTIPLTNIVSGKGGQLKTTCEKWFG